MFSRFFGKKKKDGFYAQIEDDNNSPQPEAKSTPAASAPAPAVVAETTAAPATTAKEAAKAAKEAAKAAKKAAKKSDAKPVAVAPAPAPVTAPAAPPTITNFATDYLIKPSSNSSRRRPGANMNMFLDLARQVEKPANIK